MLKQLVNSCFFGQTLHSLFLPPLSIKFGLPIGIWIPPGAYTFLLRRPHTPLKGASPKTPPCLTLHRLYLSLPCFALASPYFALLGLVLAAFWGAIPPHIRKRQRRGLWHPPLYQEEPTTLYGFGRGAEILHQTTLQQKKEGNMAMTKQQRIKAIKTAHKMGLVNLYQTKNTSKQNKG